MLTLRRLLNPPDPTSPPGEPEFDEAAYLAAHFDVATAVAEGLIPSGHFHYVGYGRAEGRALRRTLRWSEAKIAAVTARLDSPHWFERAALSAELAAAAGDQQRARTLLAAAVARAGAISNYHVFEELAAAALVVQEVEIAVHLVKDWCAANTFTTSNWTPNVLTRDAERHPAVMIWNIDGAERASFEFNSRVFAVDQTDTIFKFWLRSLPLFTAYHADPGLERGAVAVSLWDAGLAAGLSFCDFRPDHYLVPDPHFMSTNAYREERAYFADHDVSWGERRPTAFWRGSTTGRSLDGWRGLQRVRLCEIARREADDSLLDAAISRLTVFDPDVRAAIEASGLVKPYVDWRTFNQYKYQIDVDGNTNAWPGLFQKLLTGSPVLKVASPEGYRQWYYDRLEPWVNFVPVAADISDLPDTVRWLRDHDDIARSIGEAGRRLALSLDFADEIRHARSTITAAVRRSNFAGGKRLSSASSEEQRNLAAFTAKVEELVSAGKPVKIYPGCGDALANGFINLDIHRHPRLRDDDPRLQQCDLFVFPFADMPWPLPDDCVDYVFHEDFFEHISQKQQVCFLAETLRVMRPGAWHRVNTPCLAQSMKRHSDFAAGFRGVYRQEWDQWHHVSLVTRNSLEELARLVGYREVVFNQKGQGVSEFRYREGRPGADRDQILGNVFADLLK